MNDDMVCTTLKYIMNQAFVCMDEEADALLKESGSEAFTEAVAVHKKDLEGLMNRVSDFYMFSGSDSDTWDSWTDGISEQAMELFGSIKRTALELKAEQDRKGKE